MRHCTIDLTMSRYSHVFAGQEADAVAAMPDLNAVPVRESARATGTDGKPANAVQELQHVGRATNCGRYHAVCLESFSTNNAHRTSSRAKWNNDNLSSSNLQTTWYSYGVDVAFRTGSGN